MNVSWPVGFGLLVLLGFLFWWHQPSAHVRLTRPVGVGVLLSHEGPLWPYRSEGMLTLLRTNDKQTIAGRTVRER